VRAAVPWLRRQRLAGVADEIIVSTTAIAVALVAIAMAIVIWG